MEDMPTKNCKYYIGIDLGGTFIKGGLVDNTGNIITQDQIPTEREKGIDRVLSNIINLSKKLLKKENIATHDILGMGIGVPGLTNSEIGEVVYANNLEWEHVFIVAQLEKQMSMPVKIANDAKLAILGEAKFGCAKKYNNIVMLTLGTGVGSGIIIDGKLFEGTQFTGGILGHSVIVADGEQCSCGRKGCLEAYISATALIRATKRAMLADKDSKMWEIGDINNVTGKTAFDYKDIDKTANTVVKNYIEKLGVGITNIANEFRPEAIVLGGGICAQGDDLIQPLQKYVDKEIFAKEKGPRVKILAATLGNNAGVLGAVALWL